MFVANGNIPFREDPEELLVQPKILPIILFRPAGLDCNRVLSCHDYAVTASLRTVVVVGGEENTVLK
ncbi:hypothetical protein D3C87_2086360 [compost metagenome]